jgi:hypothetical protein
MRYFCKNQMRRLLVGKHPQINGIDFLEVVSPDQKTLEVHFLKPLPGPPDGTAPGKENIRITGGVRVKQIVVTGVAVNGNVLTVSVQAAGDFSTYTLQLVQSATDDAPPAGFDPELAAVPFSFKADCPTDFDCKTEIACRTDKYPELRIDYLAKDFDSFRRLMLDRLSLLTPDWKERNIADLQIALVELLAYTGDHLSYYQDAVATEAYLFKARKRISARRHARLLDYHLHNGCNARVWVHIAVEPGSSALLPAGTVLLTKGAEQEPTVHPNDLERKLQEPGITVFETKHPVFLHSAHNEIHFYTWSDDTCCLPAGSTRATLHNDPALSLETGRGNETDASILILEEVYSPTTGSTADADPKRRHAVRLVRAEKKTDIVTGIPVVEIEWREEDALPFALCISAKIGGIVRENLSVARGNIVLADQGLTLDRQTLQPPYAPENAPYRPMLPDRDISVAVPYDHRLEISRPAAAALRQDPHAAIPEVELQAGPEKWAAQRDLLGSDRFAAEFVAEIENDRSVQLRFGDDILGKKPGAGFQPQARYRIGSGAAGNVGAEAIGRIVWSTGGILRVRNPLPARGGTNPETMEEVRQFAPEAFRTQERAVTEADYAAKAERHPQVQKALARFRWTGSWRTVFLIIDRKNNLPIDGDFKKEMYRHLEQYRMAGYDLEIRPPVFVPLDIELNVCVKPGYFSSHVKENLAALFSRYDLPDGTRGFFHPDAFTFGQPVYLSAIYHRAMQVEGVASVEAKTFKRWARKAEYEKENGLIQPSESEIIQLDNDPNFPENGKINLLMFAGL